MQNANQSVYFAASNTTEGFICYFNEIFSPERLKKLVIVKGGPGTGKSHFLREIGAFYEGCGQSVTYFLCASDPKSLDGVLVDDMKIAFIDGTSPHAVDAKYPIAVEKTVDLAVFCDEKILSARRDEIRSLVKAKSNAYKRGYRFLAAAGEVDKEIYQSIEEKIMVEKMKGAAKRFCQKYLREEKIFNQTVRVTSAMNFGGLYRLHSFDAEANILCGVDNSHGLGWLFLEQILCEAKAMQKEIIVARDPLFPSRLEGIFFVKEKVCVRCETVKRDEKFDHFINMNRFIRKNGEKNGKNKMRFAEKCYAALLAGAAEQLMVAKEIHTELESIYTPSMDLNAKEAFTKRFIRALSEEGIG